MDTFPGLFWSVVLETFLFCVVVYKKQREQISHLRKPTTRFTEAMTSCTIAFTCGRLAGRSCSFQKRCLL